MKVEIEERQAVAEEKADRSIRLVRWIDPTIYRKLLILRKECLPTHWMQINKLEFQDMLLGDLHLVVQKKPFRIEGAILSQTLNKKIVDDLRKWGDPYVTQDPETLYVAFMAVSPKCSGDGTSLRLGKRFMTEAKKRSYKRISTHACTTHGFSHILQRRHGATCLYTLQDWCGTGEAFDYLEIPIT